MDLRVDHGVDPVVVAEQQDRDDRGAGPNGDLHRADRDGRGLPEELERLTVADEVPIERHGHNTPRAEDLVDLAH